MLNKSEDLKITDIIKNKELTNKAKFLFINGFTGEPTQVEKIDDTFVDVTYGKGFKGMIVLENGSKLYVAKPESEEDNVYLYNLYELEDVSETNYIKLQEIVKSEKPNFAKILGIVILVASLILVLFSLIEIITSAINSSGLMSIMSYLAFSLPFILTSLGISGLLLRDNK